MAFKKVFLLSLLMTVASFISFGDAGDKERPPRTLGWFSSSSATSQVKTEQQLPQVQTPLPSVVPTVATQTIQQPYVYNVRYYSDLSSQDRSKDSVLVGQVEDTQATRAGPCPYDHLTRVAGLGAGPKEIAGYSYQYQTPTVVVPMPSPTVTVSPPQLPIQSQQTQPQAGSSVVVPVVHHPHHHHHEHEHQPVVVPVVAPQTYQPSLQQIPSNFLPFLQAAAAAATTSHLPHQHQHPLQHQLQHQHQGVVYPFYTVPQVAHTALVNPSQQPRPQLQEYQQLQQQHRQKVVPSVVGDYPYYYIPYPEFVYIVPVLQQPQSSGQATSQQLQQGVPLHLTQRQQPQQQQSQQQQQQQQHQHQQSQSVSGQHAQEDVHRRQQAKQKQ